MEKSSSTACKVCSKCHQEKPLSDFYKHPDMTDGHLNKCKECAKSEARKNRAENIDYYQLYDRKRSANEERKLKAQRYSKTPNGRASHARSLKKYSLRYPSKYRAHNAVSNAIRDGRLKRRTSCESCGVECRADAHHCDYSKPLDVKWLCKSCHVEWHKHNKPIYPEESRPL